MSMMTHIMKSLSRTLTVLQISNKDSVVLDTILIMLTKLIWPTCLKPDIRTPLISIMWESFLDPGGHFFILRSVDCDLNFYIAQPLPKWPLAW